jgi:hypothetical protein
MASQCYLKGVEEDPLLFFNGESDHRPTLPVYNTKLFVGNAFASVLVRLKETTLLFVVNDLLRSALHAGTVFGHVKLAQQR